MCPKIRKNELRQTNYDKRITTVRNIASELRSAEETM